MSTFQEQHDFTGVAGGGGGGGRPGSISTLKQIWEVAVPRALPCKAGSKNSNIYAAPSEVNAPGILSVAQSKNEIYADLRGILSGAEDLLKSLFSAAKLSSARGGGG